MSAKYCKNCGTEVTGNYCSHCGQRTTVDQVTFKEAFHDFYSALFSIDGPFVNTLKLLFVNPGKLFRDFLYGKRKKYYKPISFFILTTVVFVLIRTLFNSDPMAGMAKVDLNSEELNTLSYKAGKFMSNNINNILFVFVFTCAMFLKLFFYKKYRFIEFLVVSFYLLSFYTIITTVSIPILKTIDFQYRALPLMLMSIYVAYAMSSFIKGTKIKIIGKAILAYFLALIFYMVLGYGLSFLIVWIKNN
ncbi:DUF3667 domain-containing protein [Tenacibaculum amylolyticum]|uniref:DUF3667 domain-containing protein n=1 Tax=Tenacibaculum amylolyticum TaxID=104269 RepID=UPI0038962986